MRVQFGEVLRLLLDQSDSEPNEVLEVFMSHQFSRFLVLLDRDEPQNESLVLLKETFLDICSDLAKQLK